MRRIVIAGAGAAGLAMANRLSGMLVWRDESSLIDGRGRITTAGFHACRRQGQAGLPIRANQRRVREPRTRNGSRRRLPSSIRMANAVVTHPVRPGPSRISSVLAHGSVADYGAIEGNGSTDHHPARTAIGSGLLPGRLKPTAHLCRDCALCRYGWRRPYFGPAPQTRNKMRPAAR